MNNKGLSKFLVDDFKEVIEWKFPKPSVNSCFKRFCDLQLLIENQGFIQSTEHRFIIIAKN